MARMVLSQDEVDQIQVLAREVVERFDSPDCEAFLRASSVLAHRLPERIRSFVNDFRLSEPDEAVCVISGYPIDHQKIGPTPRHWKDCPARRTTIEEDMLLVLFGSLVGDCIGWATQQDGHIVHDIFPIRGNENEQLGTGSDQLLWWHTEDAFHPCRGDYVGMLCLRNDDEVPTTIGTLSRIELSDEQKSLLFGEHFTIRPDESHLKKNHGGAKVADQDTLDASYARMDERNTEPDKIAVLFGHPQRPYMRLDPFFMDMERIKDPEALKSFEYLTQAIDERMENLVLRQGDICLIDNLKAVHGRKPFKARYDGRDRWLKRIIVARDLRKSSAMRPDVESRLIF